MIFILAVSLAVIVPAMFWGIPSNLDLTNHFRFALPFYDAIASGNLYPSWLAESNGGYGDPSFRFYPPALYYLLAAARFVIGNWYAATLVVFAIVSIVGGLGMYFWSRSMLSTSSAIWASVFYALAPYHLNQLYQATLLAEWAASAVLPFVFGFVERVCERGKRRDIAGLGATYGLLIFTHLPLAVIGSLAVLVYALVRIDGPDKVRKLAKLSCGAALALSLSAVYWVTMVSEVGWIGVNQIQRDASVDYRLNFLFSTFSAINLNVWWMNILALMTLLLFVPAFFVRKKGLRPAIMLTAFALFMSVPLSRPIWNLVRPLQETQFPWRWLILISMGGSILAAAGIGRLNSSHSTKRIAVFGAMTISVVFTLSHIVREAQYFPPQKFDNMLTSVRGTPSVNYWFTIWARPDIRKMSSEVEAGARPVTVNSWQSEQREFSVAAGPATEARVRTFYYPHWIAKSEAGILATRPDTDGALLIALPPNATSVELDFQEPRRNKFSTISSLSGLMIIGTLAIPLRRRQKR
ncbi:MAG TPA: 6-pyruvoyl-tetrahydropterin synthase-related protein [Pyrinomonadaceae bacterium]|nr:6-pyruvoyl-tetrahydropterin synthase-related protein [Pyrinomonadaceae bacterium]